MQMDLILLRQISVLSVLFGGIIGLVTLVPYLGTVTFTFLICFIAPVVIWLLITNKCLIMEKAQDSIIVGAVSGFISFMAFSVVYIPVSVILMRFFGLASNYGVGLMLANANLFLLAVISIFMGVVGATVNAFTGFLTYYVIELINNSKNISK